MKYMTEDNLAQFILPSLSVLEDDFNVLVSNKIKVMSDFTFLREENEYKLEISFAETDICIYREIPFNKSNPTILKHFKFYRDSQTDINVINVPFIVIELKRGKFTVDSIRARNEVARKIKRIFPFCSYILLGDQTTKKIETVFRHGKNFDDFFIYKDSVTKEQIGNIRNTFINPYMKNLKNINIL